MIANLTDVGGELYFDDNRVSSCKDGASYVAIGVDVYHDGDMVHIKGITLRNSPSSGYLRIPKQDMTQFIELLKKAYDN